MKTGLDIFSNFKLSGYASGACGRRKRAFRKKNWILLFGFIALVAFPGFVSAREEQKAKAGIVTLDEVVVSATKTEEKRKDVPSAMIVIDQTQIEESPAKTVGELLANEPGLDWRTYGDYGGASEEIHIRGMSGNATQVRVNGVTINSPSLGIADLGQIPMNNIERIEVVKGSGSVLYGSGAMAGTINIITKRPNRDEMDLKAGAGYGSQGSYRLAAEQGMFAVGDFGYYLTANRYKTNGFRSNSDLSHNDASIKLVLDKGDLLDISLYGDYIYTNFGRPGVQPPAGTRSYSFNGTEYYNSESASLLDRGRNNDAHAVLNVTSQPADWVDLRFRGDYTYMESYDYSRYVYWGMAGGSRTWVTNKVLGFEGDVDFKPFDGANFLIGSEYKHYDWENKSTSLDAFGADGETSNTDAGLHTIGVYAEGQYRPCKYIKGLAGIRHEDHSEFGTEDLPRFGLIVNPLRSTALKFNYGKHFLAPTPNDLYWPDDNYYTKGNPDLQPETGWHLDATVEQELFDNKLFLSFTYFDWDLNNKILWAPDSNWIWSPQNLNKARARGCEAGVKIGPFYDLTFALDYTYTDGEEETQYVTRPSSYTPNHLFRGDLTYRSSFGLATTATVRYVGDRYFYGMDQRATNPEGTLDSYITMDLRLEQRFYEHLLLSLQANNLFNKSYDTYFGSFTSETTMQTSLAAFPGAGRSIFFEVAYEF